MIDGALYDFESELLLLGASMYAPDACEAAFDRLAPDQFADPIAGLIFSTVSQIVRTGGAPHPTIVRDKLGAHAGFAEWGGVDQLLELWDNATTLGVSDHIEAISERAGRRALKRLLDELGPRVVDTADGTFADLLGEMEARAADIARAGRNSDQFTHAADMVRGAVERLRARSGVIAFPTGLRDLDRVMGGLNAGETTLVAARTGMGKTVAGQAIGKANAAARKGVCFFSLEMAADPMAMRLACDLAYQRGAIHFSGVSSNPTLDHALKNELTPSQWDCLSEAEGILRNWPIVYDTRAGLSMAQIEAAARRAHRRWEREGIEPGPVIVDHLGKVKPAKNRNGSKYAEMADVSGDAAEMAKRLGVPVVGLVQLNRQVESRGDDKRPQLSDLRNAGELEEDARQILMLYRPEYYLRKPVDEETFDEQVERETKLRKVQNKLFWLIEKNSNGPRDQVLTFCDVASSAVRDWDL